MKNLPLVGVFKMLALGLCVILLTGCVDADNSYQGEEAPAVVEIQDAEFEVEVADTRRERERGLSGRKALQTETGMIFIQYKEEAWAFWMKDMRFPIDIIWIGAGCQVVDVHEHLPIPEAWAADEDLPVYSPRNPALYVLEVNAGDTDRFEIGIESKVKFYGIDNGKC